MVIHAFNLWTSEAKARSTLEFEVSLVYIVSTMIARATWRNSILQQTNRAVEMAQWVRALIALPKVLSSNPSNHMVAHNHP